MSLPRRAFAPARVSVRRSGTLLLTGAALAAGALAPATAAAVDVCPGTPAPTVTGVSPNTSLNTAFTNYGNSGAGWTGADSTYSARLPNGNDLWLFSDTFMPPISAPTRPASAPLIHNSFVRQSGSTMTTIHGGTTSAPDAVMKPANPLNWYWLGAGTVNGAGTHLEIPLTEWTKTGPSAWDIAWQGNALARFPVGSLTTPTYTALPSGAGIQWTAWVARDGGYTYVYGVEDTNSGADKYLHIARISGSSLTGSWSYYKGGNPALATSWSTNEADSIRVLNHVANEHSVHRLRAGLYMLTTMDTSLPFNAQIVAYFACKPTGPFVAQTPLYTAPEAGPFGSYGDGDVYAYNAHVHPQRSSSTNVLVSYNVNSLDETVGPPGDHYTNVSIYRPRFINVGLTP